MRRNVLVGGIAGAGKSGILNVIIANLAGCRDVVLWGVDLKGGMELQPWAACFDRLATTPEEATGLFRDAVAGSTTGPRNAAAGKRVQEPAPDDPALIIITDEYAELPAEAHECADSIARRGRAVAVNLIAATQRPTQAAMGKDTAVRSQMDIRICLRVREKRDADLFLGPGSVNAGWHAHQLTQPGEFLISDPTHRAGTEPGLPADRRADSPARRAMRRRPATAAARRPDMPQNGPGSPQPGEPHRPALMTTRAGNGAVGRAERRRPRRGLRRRPGGRMRPDPPVGLLPAPRARRSGPRRTGPARLPAGGTAPTARQTAGPRPAPHTAGPRPRPGRHARGGDGE